MISAKALACVVLAGLLMTAAGTIGGYWYGHGAGVADEKGRASAEAVKDLTAIIDAGKGLINDANDASKAMRAAVAARALQDKKTTGELKDALAKTAGSRVDCRFDDDSMRQLGAARERATAAAAGGIRGELPAAGGAHQQPR